MAWRVLIALTLVACAVEIELRHRAPESSWAYQHLRSFRREAEGMALLDVVYHPGTPMGRWLGRVAAVLLLCAVVHGLVVRVPALRRWAMRQVWGLQALMQLHIVVGSVAVLLASLHAGMALSPTPLSSAQDALRCCVPWFAYWLFLVTSISGLVGRYAIGRILSLGPLLHLSQTRGATRVTKLGQAAVAVLRWWRPLHGVIGAAVAGLVLLHIAQGRPSERLPPRFGLAPGPLSVAHAPISDCARCHASTQTMRVVQCLDCHPQIGASSQDGHGLHGIGRGRELSCSACHREHRGADFEITGWEAVLARGVFDHRQTGFPLIGRHQPLTCERCHPGSPKHFIPVQTTCRECHRNDDPHPDKRPKCESCHNPYRWR